MKQYQELLQRILTEGRARSDRTGTGTVGIFGHQMRFDLSAGFPLVTTKHLHLRSIIHELLWMLSGSTNVHDLQKVGVSIWDEWAKENGELGPVYGKQWRSWEGKASISYGPGGPELEPGKPVDQIAELVANLKRDPFSRRHVISAWNVSDLKEMALAPCHCLFQFHVEEMTLRERYQWQQRANIETKTSGGPVFLFPVIDGAVAERSLTPEQIAQGHDSIERLYKNTPRLRFNCQLYQRSADVFLGVPFNISSYALLTAMIAQTCGFAPGEFIHTFGDVHIYQNHLDQVRLQLTRAPRALPRLLLNPEACDIFAFKYEDIVIDGYDPHPAIKAPVAV